MSTKKGPGVESRPVHASKPTCTVFRAISVINLTDLTNLTGLTGVLVGIVLQKLVLKNRNYEEFEEWSGVSYGLGTDVIGAGTCGKCVAGIDLTTNARFCVKIVRIVFVDDICRALISVIIMSQVIHNQLIKKI